ncbi:MAG: serine-type D-Ala-D-Ala carboxypeptidase [Cellvibrionales bacterium TMED49]|nr:serine-type D-Ala-D-Ala carboxypeptidase [Porticoccaceae bacterium]OUU38320.1 MAG: serine-type D-Ala-D-Ala carboxypeptidase [Cellvibrionales bacterium TMED49]
MSKKWFISALSCVISIIISQALLGQEALPKAPGITAKSWILIDANTGFVITENNADIALPPASLVKMMTTHIASNQISRGMIDEFENVTISDNAWAKGGAKTDGSTMFLNPRSQVSIIDLIRGIIIQSGNDAAIALAEHISGNEESFSVLMNQTARDIGMSNTFFTNSTGLPADEMRSSARDLSILARAIVQGDPDHYAIYSEKYFQHNNINQPNRNRLLWRDSAVDGLKTGHTQAAGYCLVASAIRNDMRLISVVLGAPSAEIRTRQSQKLLTYGFRHFNTKKVYTAGDLVKENAKVWFGKENFVDIVVADDVTLTFPKRAEELLTAKIIIDEQLNAPLMAGQEVGRLQVSLTEKHLIDIAIVSEKDVPQSGLLARIFDWIVLFLTKIMS